MTSYTTLIILSGLVIFSYLFDLIGGKTKIPSVILLMCLGIIIKQVLNYFGFAALNFDNLLPTLGTLGLVLIVFEGALELRYSRDKNSIIKKSFFSALIILLVTAFLITWIIYQMSGDTIYKCFINAIPFCVISSAVAIPAASNLSKEKKEFIVYESSFSDILTVVLFNFMTNNKQISFASFTKLGAELGVISIVVICSCLLLLYLIGRLTHHVKSFLVISILILVYSIGQLFHLSSLIIVLALGLFLNNASQIKLPWFRKYFIYPNLRYDIKQLFQLSAESAFLMRTFFFIMFGYTMDVYQLEHWTVLINGGFILLGIYAIRFLYIKLVSRTDLMPELVLIPRGLISVLLYYSLPPDMKIKGVETGLLFVVILGTSIILSLGLLATKRQASRQQGDGDFVS
ncbi:sodium/proton antiporter, CPA1 family [Mucilaginibacter mallensis]|uniref:Sodium/proton antiporter, CPA1 family n=1 Tax=Mucilaginibacter mallensis TaxID=652787 RepID=A0A1H1QUX5_MUCMA|nr:sodium:proton antiporter [Mucilaginibacter mallensis]SDS27113.1 sodium/proton antiporter, CPA1 family [Mucilaginibacter mallensis]